MSKLKVGDKVLSDGLWLPSDTIYTVHAVDSNHVVVKGYPGRYSKEQFTLAPEEKPKKPHVHAELMKAYADDTNLKFQVRPEGCKWRDVDIPAWRECSEYRIKPDTEAIEAEIASLTNSLAVTLKVIVEAEEDVKNIQYKINKLKEQL